MSGGPVPTTRRYQIFIEKAIAVQKVAIRTTSVQHAGAIVEVSIPFPCTCICFHRRICAVDR